MWELVYKFPDPGVQDPAPAPPAISAFSKDTPVLKWSCSPSPFTFLASPPPSPSHFLSLIFPIFPPASLISPLLHPKKQTGDMAMDCH